MQKTDANSSLPGSGLPLGMPATRKLSADELGLMVLLLLSQHPRYGSELADELARLSRSFYRPSPGVLYPRLASLSKQQLVQQRREGRRKYYQITSAGRLFLDEHRPRAEQIAERLRRAGRKLLHIQAALAETGSDENTALPMAQELLTARMDMKAALYESRHLDSQGQQEVLTILRETASRIRDCIRARTDHDN